MTIREVTHTNNTCHAMPFMREEITRVFFHKLRKGSYITSKRTCLSTFPANICFSIFNSSTSGHWPSSVRGEKCLVRGKWRQTYEDYDVKQADAIPLKKRKKMRTVYMLLTIVSRNSLKLLLRNLSSRIQQRRYVLVVSSTFGYKHLSDFTSEGGFIRC